LGVHLKKSTKGRAATLQISEHHEDAKLQLLDSAKKLFATQGYDGTGVREIAKASGVNIGSISYYFKGKEGLFRSCIEGFGERSVAAADRVLKTPTSVAEYRTRLEVFISEFLDLHFREREICEILHREMANNEIAHDVFNKSFAPMLQSLESFFAEAQKKKIVRHSLNPAFLTMSLIGTMIHMLKFSSSKTCLSDLQKKIKKLPAIDKMATEIVAIWCDGSVERE
jgi:AcrR family transcriptional regulator